MIKPRCALPPAHPSAFLVANPAQLWDVLDAQTSFSRTAKAEVLRDITDRLRWQLSRLLSNWLSPTWLHILLSSLPTVLAVRPFS